MLGDSSLLGSSISRDVTAAVEAPEGGGSGGGGVASNSGEEERSGSFRGGGEELLGSGERSFGCNRWPRQETLALLQIRSDMDVAFRDASVKGPLWEEVSRKLAALGFHRSAKKCKEKFENVYKYHRRTKEGRTGKTESKTYRFFDQLEALENQPPTPTPASTHHHHQQSKPHQSTMAAAAATMATMSNPPPSISHLNSSTLPSSAAPHPIITNVPSQDITNSIPPTNPIVFPPPPPAVPHTINPTNNPNPNHHATFPSSYPTIPTDLLSNSTSSSTSSDEELEGRAKKKRKWKDFFERLMKEVLQKQEDLQKKFLEAIEKREHERMVREEAWRMQEMARINREREILAQERSIAAAKDSAVMSFLQKISEQQQQIPNQNRNLVPSQSQINNTNLRLPLQPHPTWQPTPVAVVSQQPAAASIESVLITNNNVNAENNSNNNNNSGTPVSSSRWPKVEVQALIELRTSLDSKYQENGPKGPLWEEISGAMRKLGYNRSSKRCKEKWENINKYFKKVKESNKRRPEDSKTCPYFHLLDSLYRERNKFGDDHQSNSNTKLNTSASFSGQLKPENSVPLMVRPEQQWPPQQQQDQGMDGGGLMDVDQHQKNQEENLQEKENMDDDDVDDDDDDDDDEEDEEEDEGNYEIVANKPAPVDAATAE